MLTSFYNLHPAPQDAILAELMPVVTRVLGYCAKEQPDDPISELVKGLREAAAKVDERSVSGSAGCCVGRP